MRVCRTFCRTICGISKCHPHDLNSLQMQENTQFWHLASIELEFDYNWGGRSCLKKKRHATGPSPVRTDESWCVCVWVACVHVCEDSHWSVILGQNRYSLFHHWVVVVRPCDCCLCICAKYIESSERCAKCTFLTLASTHTHRRRLSIQILLFCFDFKCHHYRRAYAFPRIMRVRIRSCFRSFRWFGAHTRIGRFMHEQKVSTVFRKNCHCNVIVFGRSTVMGISVLRSSEVVDALNFRLKWYRKQTTWIGVFQEIIFCIEIYHNKYRFRRVTAIFSSSHSSWFMIHQQREIETEISHLKSDFF